MKVDLPQSFNNFPGDFALKSINFGGFKANSAKNNSPNILYGWLMLTGLIRGQSGHVLP